MRPQVGSMYVGPRLGLSMLSLRSVNPILAPSPPCVSLSGPMSCEPILALAPPYVGACCPYNSLCWCYEAPGWVYVCWPEVGSIYAVTQVCQPNMGPISPLCWPMLAYVGSMVAYVSLFWPYLPLMLAHVTI